MTFLKKKFNSFRTTLINISWKLLHERSLKKIRTIYSYDFIKFALYLAFYDNIFMKSFSKLIQYRYFFSKIDLCTFLGSRKVASAPRNQRSAILIVLPRFLKLMINESCISQKNCQEMAPHVSMTNQTLSNAEELRSRVNWVLCNFRMLIFGKNHRQMVQNGNRVSAFLGGCLLYDLPSG